jgi:hypothetical protein
MVSMYFPPRRINPISPSPTRIRKILIIDRRENLPSPPLKKQSSYRTIKMGNIKPFSFDRIERRPLRPIPP